MFRTIFSRILFVLVLLAAVLLTAGSAIAAPTGVAYGESDAPVGYSRWQPEISGDYSGGSSHWTNERKHTAKFQFTGTSIAWITRKAPWDGKAKVMIDGVNKGVFDLYGLTFQYQYKINFTGLTNTKHTIVIKVLNKGNPDSYHIVALDAFIVGGVVTQDTSPLVTYNSWKVKKNSAASNGSYRATGKKGETAGFYGYGNSIDWVTATGPSYGKVEVFVNAVSQGVFDLYSPEPRWHVVKTFPSIESEVHYIEIRVLGEKNPASIGNQVVIDGFVSY